MHWGARWQQAHRRRRQNPRAGERSNAAHALPGIASSASTCAMHAAAALCAFASSCSSGGGVLAAAPAQRQCWCCGQAADAHTRSGARAAAGRARSTVAGAACARSTLAGAAPAWRWAASAAARGASACAQRRCAEGSVASKVQRDCGRCMHLHLAAAPSTRMLQQGVQRAGWRRDHHVAGVLIGIAAASSKHARSFIEAGSFATPANSRRDAAASNPALPTSRLSSTAP